MQRLGPIPFTRAPALLAGLLVAATVGCASTQGEELVGDDAEALAIEVKNDLIPPASLTITLVPETGTPRMVGIVTPSATRTLTLEPVPVAGRFRLMAETTAGAEIYSNPFLLGDASRVIWDLSLNSVRLVEGAGS